MKLGVLCTSNSWYLRDLERAAPDGMELVPLSFTQLAAHLLPEPRIFSGPERLLMEFDGVLVRSMPPGTLEQVVFRMNALHRLAASGTPVVNPPRCLEVAIDKYLALAQLQAAGLLVPPTRVGQTFEQAMLDFQHLGGDVVVKPIFGGEGRGITRIQDEAIAWRVFKTLAQLGQVIYQQQFIPHPGYDLRVLLIGSRVYAVRRCNACDWRTNVSRGARAERCEVDIHLIEMARRAAETVGAPLAGVDILTGLDGRHYLLELNAVPGWRGLARAYQRDISAEVLQWIVGRIAEGGRECFSLAKKTPDQTPDPFISDPS